MDYDSMTDVELKKLLIKTMRERESIHYVLGWLEMSYVLAAYLDVERAVAIKQLRVYEETK